MEHGKFVRNKTGGVLYVTLLVRLGAEPGELSNIIDDTLDEAEEKFMPYGNDENPFIDGIRVRYELPGLAGGGSRSYEAGPRRGSPEDTAMNTNDTVTVWVAHEGDDHDIHLDFSNS